MKKASKIVLILRGLFIIDELEDRMGLNPGAAFYDWLTEALRAEGIRTVAELKQRMNALPAGIRLRSGKKLSKDERETYLALVAADITTETKADFPRMASLYWENADQMNPAEFVRASMSIPFFFEPLHLRDVSRDPAGKKRWETLAGYNKDIPATCVLVDGGIMSNFPIDLFHSPETVPVAPTFGVRLGSSHRRIHHISSVTKLVGAVFDSARHTLDYDFIAKHPDYNRLVAYVDTGRHFWLNFALSDEAKVDLFVRGVRAACDFLAGFNWPKYKELRRRIAKTYLK
jgi:NTE family protein